MSLTDYVIMPGADYLDACNATREKTGGTEPIKSGEMGGLIRGISGGGASGGDSGNVAKGICEGLAFDLTGDNVETVVDFAFCYDGYGTAVTVPRAKVKSVNLPNATSIGEMAFRMQPELTSVNLPKVTHLSSQAFFQCPNLEKVDLGYVEGTDGEAFYECGKLTALIVRSSEKVSMINLADFVKTPISALNGTGFVYIPASMEQGYRDEYEWQFAIMGLSGAFDLLFRKIEDYPEICG